MKRNNVFLIIILSVFLFTSCISNKPVAYKYSSPDYNGRVVVNNPQNKKKANGLGITIGLAFPAVGGFAGAQSGIVKYQDGNTQKTSTVGGAVLGTMAGAGVSYLIGQMAGYNKITPVKDFDKWAKKVNRDYLVLEASSSRTVLIDRKIESRYTVYNLQDVHDFKKMFPQSQYNDDVVLSGTKNLRRESLPELIALFPTEKSTEQAKIKYIISSTTFSEAVDAIQRYKVNYDTELHLVQLIKNVENSIKFLKLYPNTTRRKTAILNAFKDDNQSKVSWANLYKTYGNEIFLAASDLTDASNNIKKNYYYAMYAYFEINTVSKFDRFNTQYAWLTYPDKKTDILSIYWDMLDNSYSSGMSVINGFKDILANPAYSLLKITSIDIKNVMENKLKKEIQKVDILSPKHLASYNKEWEKWKQSDYTAGLVSVSGQIQFLIYGELENKSKFDLPIEVAAEGTLIKTQNFKGLGWVSDVLNTVNPNKMTVIGKATHSCFYPVVPSKEKILFAVLLDFGKDVAKLGINVLDIIKASEELSLGEIIIGLNFNSTVPSRSQLQKQSQWLQFAHTGLPSTKLVDFFRGEEFRQDIWDIRHEEYLERMSNKIAAGKKIDPENINPPETRSISNWTRDAGEHWYTKKISWNDDTYGEITKTTYGSHTYYHSVAGEYNNEHDAIIAEYAYQKYFRIRQTGKNK
jgi:hypothetical protein